MNSDETGCIVIAVCALLAGMFIIGSINAEHITRNGILNKYCASIEFVQYEKREGKDYCVEESDGGLVYHPITWMGGE